MTRLLLLSLIMFSLTLITKTSGQPGSPVTDFGNEGMTVLDVDGRSDRFNDMKILPDGSIIAVGNTWVGDDSDFLVAKFDQDGIPDPFFGTDGLIRGSLTDSTSERAESIAVAVDGGFYVAVNAFGNPNKIYILKYGSNGLLETTFGKSGIFQDHPSQGNWSCNLIYVTIGQEILVATESGPLIRVFKLSGDGTVDSSFANGGELILDQGNNFQRILDITSMATPAGFSHIMVGENNDETGWNYHLFSITHEGQLDSTFGVNGYISEDFLPNISTAQSVVVEPDGNILMAGGWYNGSNNDALIAKYNSRGQLDSTFGENGIVILPTGGNNIMYELKVLSDASSVAAGDRAIIRTQPGGDPDSTYSEDGILNFGGFGPHIYALELDDQENTVVAGSLFNGENLDLLIAKYRTFATTRTNDQIDQALWISVHPNPFNDHLQCSFALSSRAISHTYLTDLQGKKITEIFPMRIREVGVYHTEIQIGKLIPPGIYVVHHSSGNQYHSFELIKT